MCLIREEQLVEFFDMALEVLKLKYSAEASRVLTRTLELRTKDLGKTALHLATQNNKRVTPRQLLVRRMIAEGVDYRLKDNDGCSVMHTAAIFGHCALLVIFHKELGMDLTEFDANGRTPLHSASAEGSCQSADLLISWAADLNLRDNDGHTPLHLTAIAAQPQSYRIARHLLMKGANRELKDKNGATALDISRIRQTSELTELLEPLHICVELNPIKTPVHPVKANRLSFTVYYVIISVRLLLLMLFIFPAIPLGFSVISLLIQVIVLVLFIIVSKADPGYVYKDQTKDLLYLYENYNADFVCFYCETIRTASTKHCQYCDRCVKGFDHHCPWINNCVGRDNHSLFVVFVAITEVDFAYHTVVPFFQETWDVTGAGAIYSPLSDSPNWTHFCVMTVSIFCLIAFIIVSPLLYVQVTNFFLKTTTRQRFGYKRDNNKAQSLLDDTDARSDDQLL